MLTIQRMMTKAIAFRKGNILMITRGHRQDSVTDHEENRNGIIMKEDHFERCTALGRKCSVESDDGSLEKGDIVNMAKYVGDIVILRKRYG